MSSFITYIEETTCLLIYKTRKYFVSQMIDANVIIYLGYDKQSICVKGRSGDYFKTCEVEERQQHRYT